MKSSVQYTSWLVLLPVLVAALFNYPLLQQSLQRVLPGWTNTNAPSVILPQGKLVGKLLSKDDYPQAVESFLGVPYALPPVGSLRFANPVPVGPSDETFEASEFGPRSVLMSTSSRIHILTFA